MQQNNVRETRADMSKANRSQIEWVQPDVCGLFSVSVGSFSANVGSWPNGIKLASERLLDQLPAQLLSGFNHQGEALGSPLLDPRLHTIGARGVHDQRD
jgi:hypothetical protein